MLDARRGNRMAEILNEGNRVYQAFRDVAKAVAQLTEDASASAL